MRSKLAHWLREAALAAVLLSPAVMIQRVAAQPNQAEAVREIEVVVDGSYKPARIEIHEGERVRLKFVRKEFTPCTKEVLFPALKIRRELPPNQPVLIELPALKAGEYEFKCGMNMIRGTLVVLRGHAHG